MKFDRPPEIENSRKHSTIPSRPVRAMNVLACRLNGRKINKARNATSPNVFGLPSAALTRQPSAVPRWMLTPTICSSPSPVCTEIAASRATTRNRACAQDSRAKLTRKVPASHPAGASRYSATPDHSSGDVSHMASIPTAR